MTATAFVDPKTDTLIVDVTGANANEKQTAMLRLWAPRMPKAVAMGRAGQLSESWVDNKNPESSGRAFGSLSAITAEGREVAVVVTDSLTITVSFKPFEDGHFRVVVGSPHFEGKGDAQSIAAKSLVVAPESSAQGVVAGILGTRCNDQDQLEGWFRGVHGEPAQHLFVCCGYRQGRGVSGIASGHCGHDFGGGGCAQVGSVGLLALESAHAGLRPILARG